MTNRPSLPTPPKSRLLLILSGLLVGSFPLFSTITPCHAQAPADAAETESVETTSFSVLKKQANEFLSNGDLVKAKPILNELISRFEHLEGKDKNVDLAGPTFLMAKASALAYQESGDKKQLAEAAKWYARFIEKYPSNKNITEALEAQSAIYAETGDMKNAAKVMQSLLAPPYLEMLPAAKQLEILENLVRVYYLDRNLKEGLPWFEKLIELATNDPERQAFGASAAFEAQMEADQLDKAMALLPLLSENTETRYRPQLNIAFLRASDQLVGKGRYGDAALVLGLTLTTDKMLQHQTRRKALLEQRIADLEKRTYGIKQSRELIRRFKTDLRSTDRMIEVMGNLPPLSTDLLARKARNYVKTKRTYEAFWLFFRLMEENPKNDQIEFFTYATFSNANSLGKSETVVRVGEQYLKAFPKGSYLEDVVLIMLPSYRETNPKLFVKHSKNYLNQYPDNDNAAIVLSQYGQYLISQKQFEVLETEFATLTKKHPKAYYGDGLNYWRGLGLLIQREYDRAYPLFEEILQKFTNSAYAPESLFRMGVIHFAREEFIEAATKLAAYTDAYPNDGNIDQAYYFRAQIAKLANNSEAAAALYKKGSELTKSKAMRDMITFELSDLFVDSGEPQKAISLIKDYLADNQEGEVSQAYAKLGYAYEGARDIPMAIETYETAIRAFTSHKEDIGIDAILLDYAPMINRSQVLFSATVAFLDRLTSDPEFLNKLVTDRGELFDYFYEHKEVDPQIYTKFRNAPAFGKALLTDPLPLTEIAKTYSKSLAAIKASGPVDVLESLLTTARGKGDFVAELRLAMALDAADETTTLSRAVTTDDLIGLTPSTLFYAGKASLTAGDSALAKEAWQNLLRNFPLENQAVVTSLALAELAVKENDLETAITHFRTVHDQFPASPEAPLALLREATTQLSLKQFDASRKLCERILRVPSWRGPLHAQALYKIGKAFEEEERFGEARGFYERVYIGYGHFSAWAGKAYLADAIILRAMGETDDAKRILAEAQERLADSGEDKILADINQLALQL